MPLHMNELQRKSLPCWKKKLKNTNPEWLKQPSIMI